MFQIFVLFLTYGYVYGPRPHSIPGYTMEELGLQDYWYLVCRHCTAME